MELSDEINGLLDQSACIDALEDFKEKFSKNCKMLVIAWVDEDDIVQLYIGNDIGLLTASGILAQAQGLFNELP